VLHRISRKDLTVPALYCWHLHDQVAYAKVIEWSHVNTAGTYLITAAVQG
jgi:hypothetical protein